MADNPTGIHIPADKLMTISEGWYCTKCNKIVERDPYNPNQLTCDVVCMRIWEGDLLPDHWVTTRVYHMRNDEVMAERGRNGN